MKYSLKKNSNSNGIIWKITHRTQTTFGADEDIREYLNKIPFGHMSDFINNIIRAYIKHGFVINEEILSRRGETLLMDIDTIGRGLIQNEKISE